MLPISTPSPRQPLALETILRLRAIFIHPSGISPAAFHRASDGLRGVLASIWGPDAVFEQAHVSEIASEVVVSETGRWERENKRDRLESTLRSFAEALPSIHDAEHPTATMQWIYSQLMITGDVVQGHTLSWHRGRPDSLVCQSPVSVYPSLYENTADRLRLTALMEAVGLRQLIGGPVSVDDRSTRPRFRL